MPKAKKIAVCVDSSIFLAEIFGNETQSSRSGAIDRFHQIFPFEKSMSETVKTEVENRLASVTLLIDCISKDFIKSFYIFKDKDPIIDLSDLKFIQSFFSALKKNYSVRSTEMEIINNIESVLARFLAEKYNKKSPQKTNDFLLDSMVEFNKILSSMKYDFNKKLGSYQIFSETIDANICNKLENEPKLEKTVRKKPQDIRILCEVEAYQRKSGKICFLATVDHNDFLNNVELIESLIGIKCVDPIYLPNEFEN